MTDSPSAHKIRRALFFFCLLCALLLLLYPRPAMEAVREALRLCTQTIVPSLFPFLVMSALLTALAPLDPLKKLLSPLTAPLFRLSGTGAVVLALGFTGGYPVGVRTAVSLYRAGHLSKGEAERLLAFCNNSGPGFLLGVVGVGIFESTAVGLWLYGIHILAALSVGLLFRFYPDSGGAVDHSRPKQSSGALPRVFTEAVTSSFTAVLNICAFVLVFMIVLRMLAFTGALHLLSAALAWLLSPVGMTEQLATALIAGFLELSTGSACLQGAPLTAGTAALASFLLGWGGLSVHCQSTLFLSDSGLSFKPYFIGKFLQGLFSCCFTLLLFPLISP